MSAEAGTDVRAVSTQPHHGVYSAFLLSGDVFADDRGEPQPQDLVYLCLIVNEAKHLFRGLGALSDYFLGSSPRH